MVVLTDMYKGAEDAYMYGDRKWNTLQTEFLETRRKTVREEVEEYVEELPQEFIDAEEYFLESPLERITEYLKMVEKYKDYNRTVKSRKVVRDIYIQEETTDNANVGYTGLRFQGDTTAIKSIELEIGGHRINKVYPSITGHFDSINLFELTIPNPIFYKVRLRVEFLKDAELTVEWDVVKILEDVNNHELLYSSTQYSGVQEIKAGESEIKLNYNHPVEELTIYTDNPVERMSLWLNDVGHFHIPYTGVQNMKHVYKYVFQTPVNFSRIDSSLLKLKSVTDTSVYPFAKSKNVARFRNGMAGMAFSK